MANAAERKEAAVDAIFVKVFFWFHDMSDTFVIMARFVNTKFKSQAFETEI